MLITDWNCNADKTLCTRQTGDMVTVNLLIDGPGGVVFDPESLLPAGLVIDRSKMPSRDGKPRALGIIAVPPSTWKFWEKPKWAYSYQVPVKPLKP